MEIAPKYDSIPNDYPDTTGKKSKSLDSMHEQNIKQILDSVSYSESHELAKKNSISSLSNNGLDHLITPIEEYEVDTLEPNKDPQVDFLSEIASDDEYSKIIDYNEPIFDKMIELLYDFPNLITSSNIKIVLDTVFSYFKTNQKEPLSQEAKEDQVKTLAPLMNSMLEKLQSIDFSDEDSAIDKMSCCMQSIYKLIIESLGEKGFYIAGDKRLHDVMLHLTKKSVMRDDASNINTTTSESLSDS